MRHVLHWLRHSRLVRQFVFYVVLFGAVMALLITVLELGRQYGREVDKLDAHLEHIQQAYAHSVEENVWINDVARLQTLLQGMLQWPHLVYAEVRSDGQTLAQWGQPLEGPGVTRVFPLEYAHKGRVQTIGELEVHASHRQVWQQLQHDFLFLTAVNLLKAVVAVGFIAWVFYWLVGRHLLHMARYAVRSQKRLRHSVPLALDRSEPRRPDELSRLTRAINHMKDSLLALNHEQHERAQALERELAERKRVESRLHIMASVFASSREAIVITDASSRIIAVNQAFSALTGFTLDEVLGQNPRVLSAGLTPAEVYREMWQRLGEQGSWQGEVWDRRKDGKVYPKWLSITAVTDNLGQVVNYIGIFSDISERKEAEERIYHLAHHDSLTGLANRMSLTLELKTVVRQATRDKQQLAVMFIDLDQFKEINDVHGHDAGDRLLVEVARRLQQSVRHGDMVARLGGDEFVVVLRLVTDREAAAHVAEKVRSALEAPYVFGDLVLRTASSIGVAVFPQDGSSSEELMKSADTAMYHAKSSGRNNVQFYSKGMEDVVVERVRMVGELRKALEEGQFELHYQPQLCARSGRLVGVEALLRWKHPDQGWISPAKFIPVAEHSGLIVPLGEWVLAEAMRQLREWRDEWGLPDFRLAVNLSTQQLVSAGLADTVVHLLQWHQIPPHCLELEITESTLMENMAESVGRLRTLRDMGVHLAIDDFGTGYSSLSYLKQLPVHTLKLDRSFVNGAEVDESNAAICKSIIVLAHNLGLGVVAEGVETEAQRSFLRNQGCDVLQGYLLGRPVPPADLAAQWFGQEAQETAWIWAI